MKVLSKFTCKFCEDPPGLLERLDSRGWGCCDTSSFFVDVCFLGWSLNLDKSKLINLPLTPIKTKYCARLLLTSHYSSYRSFRLILS